MSKIKYCPECQIVITPGNDFCSCGWKSGKSTKKEQNHHKYHDDDRKGLCDWEGNGRECTSPGVHSFNTKGKGEWYCFKHLNDPELVEGLRIIDDYEENGAPLPRSPIRVMMDNSLKMGQGLQQMKGESIHEFRTRVIEAADKLQRGFRLG